MSGGRYLDERPGRLAELPNYLAQAHIILHENTLRTLLLYDRAVSIRMRTYQIQRHFTYWMEPERIQLTSDDILTFSATTYSLMPGKDGQRKLVMLEFEGQPRGSGFGGIYIEGYPLSEEFKPLENAAQDSARVWLELSAYLGDVTDTSTPGLIIEGDSLYIYYLSENRRRPYRWVSNDHKTKGGLTSFLIGNFPLDYLTVGSLTRTRDASLVPRYKIGFYLTIKDQYGRVVAQDQKIELLFTFTTFDQRAA